MPSSAQTIIRVLLTRIDELTPLRFILAVALAAGTLGGIPMLFAGHSNGAAGTSVALFLIAASSGLWWAGALIVLLAVVRRPSWSVWKTAWNVTLALALGDAFAFAVAVAAASIDTQGEYLTAYVHAPLSSTVPGFLVPIVLRSPVRFFGSAAAVALGRHLLGSSGPLAPQPLRPGDGEAAT